MKITVPIPAAKSGDKQYAVEFDSEHITKTGMSIGYSESFDDRGVKVVEHDGTSTLTLSFGSGEHRPMWVIIEEGPDGTIAGSRPADSND